MCFSGTLSLYILLCLDAQIYSISFCLIYPYKYILNSVYINLLICHFAFYVFKMSTQILFLFYLVGDNSEKFKILKSCWSSFCILICYMYHVLSVIYGMCKLISLIIYVEKQEKQSKNVIWIHTTIYDKHFCAILYNRCTIQHGGGVRVKLLTRYVQYSSCRNVQFCRFIIFFLQVWKKFVTQYVFNWSPVLGKHIFSNKMLIRPLIDIFSYFF